MTKKSSLSCYISKDLLFLNTNFSSTNELFQAVSKRGLKYGLVNYKFLPSIIQREAKFPTGLELGNVNVAIPHTDVDTIEHPFIALNTNSQGISFCRMDDSTVHIQARVIFILGMKEPHAQLELLQSLMNAIQNPTTLNNLVNAQNFDDVLKVLQDY